MSGSLDGESLEARLAVGHLLGDVLETLGDGVLCLLEVLLHEDGAHKLVDGPLALDELELLHHELVLGLLCHQRLALARNLLDLLLHGAECLHLLLKLPQTCWIHALHCSQQQNASFTKTNQKKKKSRKKTKQKGNKEKRERSSKSCYCRSMHFPKSLFFPVDLPFLFKKL